MALDGHFVSGVMRGFSRCHFDYISESVVVVELQVEEKDLFAEAGTTNFMHPGILVTCIK